MKNTLSPVCICSAALTAVLCLTGTVAFAQSSSGTPTLDSQSLAFLTLINSYRAQNGAGPLQVSVALENSSQWMSNDMASKNYFAHTDSLGRDPFTRMAAFGYPYGPSGENIAAGFADAQSTLSLWENTCDADASGQCTYAHRQNMLNPSYVVIGIGRAFNASSVYKWYWTTDFGGYLDQTLPTSPALAPSIASFAASPPQITAGQSAALTWSVSGASTVSLDNGIGDVSSVTSRSVSPAQTTTYTLTATNSAGSATAVATVTVNPQVSPPPAANGTSIWPDSAVPAISGIVDGNSLELGVKFRSDVSGSVTGIRFYKGRANTGTHTGSLWTSTGSLLATGAFTNETASGWQTLSFTSPVAISANTTYIASYNSPNGVYAVDFGYFQSHGADNAPLHALQSGVDGPDGVFIYSAGGQCPNNGYGHNYWVDVVFSATGTSAPPPPPASTTPQSIVAISGSLQSVTVGGVFGSALQAQVLDGSSNPVSGVAVTFQAPSAGASTVFAGGGASATATTNAQGIAVSPALTANGTAGSYTVTASAASLAPALFSLTNVAANAPPPSSGTTTSIWPNSATPAISGIVDGNSLELGVKFRADVSGSITGIRFYKGRANTGMHTGSLWTSTGTLLATGAFVNETASGWQTLLFSSPVAISANTTYVASYHSFGGVFAIDFNYFETQSVDNAPLHALRYGADGPNGVFVYSSGGQFPTTDGYGNNYWVDVVFQY